MIAWESGAMIDGMSDEFETWLDAFDLMYSALPARGATPCPDCGGTTLHLVFTGDPRSRRAYAQLWCEKCVRGIHVSQTVVPTGVPMNDYRMPREERPHQAPDFVLIQP
ncbi:hypothetical protein GCM10023320_69700 [Pseudonocardia adelaidensis]|uniref:Uncharacterized protein n=2 Tax=Pseudonocardia adelaidensis TaxID=648754 RepID=A0ABP9P0M5_9PSEU